MPLRKKYPISDWVLSQDNVAQGDIVAFHCENTKKEVHAEVSGFPSPELRQYISCRRLDTNVTEVVNFYSVIVYCIKKACKEKSVKECSCGAKFTSNPKFHLNYCDILSSNLKQFKGAC